MQYIRNFVLKPYAEGLRLVIIFQTGRSVLIMLPTVSLRVRGEV